MKTEFKSFKEMSEDEKDAYILLVEEITNKVDEYILSKIIKKWKV